MKEQLTPQAPAKPKQKLPVAKGTPTSKQYNIEDAQYEAGHHTGIDYAGRMNDPIYAAAGGTVISVLNSGNEGYGKHVIIKHDDGTFGLYGHMNKFNVKSGDKVAAGAVIGGIGDTGNSSGSHLHFEVRTAYKYGNDIDPVAWLNGQSEFTPSDSTIKYEPAGGSKIVARKNKKGDTVQTMAWEDVLAQLESDFGLTTAILNLDKTDPTKGYTLKEALAVIKKKKLTDPNRIANELAKTNWFQQNGVGVTQRMAEEKRSAGVFKSNVDTKYAAIKDAASARGVTLSEEDLRSLARDTYIFSLDDSQILDRLVKAKSMQFTGGGAVGETLNNLKGLAFANGVKLSDSDINSWSAAVAAGDKTYTDYVSVIRENAASTHQVFADQIRAGQNLSDLTRPYKQIASELLEVPDVGWDDPLFKDGRAFTSTGEDGKLSQRTLYDFRKEVMSDDRWQYTDNAKKSATDFGLSVLKRFGMA